MSKLFGALAGAVVAVMLVGLALVGTAQAATSDSSRRDAISVRGEDCKPSGNEPNTTPNSSKDCDKDNNGIRSNTNGQDDSKKITICHATGSATNPWVEITISVNGWNGHQGHGDLNPAPAGGCPAAAAASISSNLVVVTEPLITQLRNAGLTVVEIRPGVIEINGTRFIVFSLNDVVASKSIMSVLSADTQVFRAGANLIAPQADAAPPVEIGYVLSATYGPALTRAQLVSATQAAPAPAATGSGGFLEKSSGR